VLALAGGDALEKCLDALRAGGKVAYPNGVEPVPKARPGLTMIPYDALFGDQKVQWAQLNQAIEAAKFEVPIAATFALARRASRHNRALALQTRVDASTGLLNRPNWEGAVDSELRRFKRGDAAAALMMIDIDHFKDINDRYGHLAGDEVIRTTAAIIRACIREVDVPGRYGGDEFGLLLLHTGTHAALAAAERIRQRVAETSFERAPGVHCTLSIGIAQASRGMEDVHAWISQADAALYQAKTLGRNQTVRL
jgi:diguanylate cyclase